MSDEKRKEVNRRFAERMNNLTKTIESCWDENNPDDGKTFDQRLREKLSEKDYNLVSSDF